MAYAILRFAKRKGGAAKAIAAHNERTKEAYASNPDIDKSRTVQNYHLIVPRWSYGQEIRHRISMASCRVRRDSVKFVETLITTSPEFAKAHEAEMPEYFERALGFLKERVGEENIFSAVVHMDEKTPHLHLCFVPLTKDNRLSAKEILGNKKRMIQWQDDFYACMLTVDFTISSHCSMKSANSTSSPVLALAYFLRSSMSICSARFLLPLIVKPVEIHLGFLFPAESVRFRMM